MKKIYLNETEQAALVKEFADKLASARLSDGKITFTYSFDEKVEEKNKVKLCFTAKAWLKIQSLVGGFSTEVGWHGTCEKVPGGYLVTDIIVYPQTVTGATVNTDENEYSEWKKNLSDEQDAKLRFHGHSHVSMAVNPSAVDTDHRNQVLATIPKDGFYVFVIANKSGDMSVKIYDMADNRIYDKEDVEIGVLLDDNTTAAAFIEASKELVRNKVYTTTTTDKKSQTVTKKQAEHTLLDGTTYTGKSTKKKGASQPKWNQRTGRYDYEESDYPYGGEFYDDGSYQWGCSQR